jgi:hypothetical protein
MRKVLRVRDQWAAIAGVPLASEDLLPDDDPPPLLRANGVAAPAWPD